MNATKLALALLSLAAFGSQAGAADPSKATAAGSKKDPNEVICERQKLPGSRLATAKVCKTRAEWADLRNQDRADLERAQTQRGISQ